MPPKTSTCSPQAWNPSWRSPWTRPRVEENAYSSTGIREQDAFFLFLRGWNRIGLLILLWPKIKTVFSNLDGVTRLLLLIFERHIFSIEELVPSNPSVGFPRFSLKDQGCSHILENSRLKLAWLSVMNGSFSSICGYQDHHRWAFMWKTRLFMFSLPGILHSLPFILLPTLCPSAILVPPTLSCGATSLVGQVLHSLLTWLVFAAILTAGIWEKQTESHWSPHPVCTGAHTTKPLCGWFGQTLKGK